MRRRRHDTSGNLDSLLDTMTNVVGILVIAAAVTQISVGDAVQGAASSRLEDPDALRAQAKRLEELLAQLRKKWGVLEAQLEPNRADAERVRELIRKLRQELRQPLEGDPRTLADRLATLKIRLTELERRIAAAQARRDELKAALEDHTPKRRIRLRLPEPRPPPRGSEPTPWVCRGGRIYPLSDELARKIDRAVRTVMNKPRGNMSFTAADLSRIEEHFRRNDIGDEFFRARVKNLGINLLLKLERRHPEQGSTLGDLEDPRCPYRAWLRRADPNKQWIKFLVWADSFELYIEAREYAETRTARGRASPLPAAWIPFSTGEEIQELLLGGGAGGEEWLPD